MRRLREEEKQAAKRKVKDADGTRSEYSDGPADARLDLRFIITFLNSFCFCTESARAKSHKSTKQVLDDARRARTERTRNRAVRTVVIYSPFRSAKSFHVNFPSIYANTVLSLYIGRKVISP